MNLFHVLNTKEDILKMSKQFVSFDFHGVLNVFLFIVLMEVNVCHQLFGY